MRNYATGKFRPKNPAKYKGNATNIYFRSSWELRLMGYLDTHPDIIEWSSEEVVVPYVSPVDGQRHRYFVDFWVKQKNKNGKVEILLLEVKPKAQTMEPKPQQRKTKSYISQVMAWGVNSAKWRAARNLCEQNNWTFKIITEHELFGDFHSP